MTLLTPEAVITAAADTFGVSADELRGYGRHHPLVHYRHAAAWVAIHVTPLGYVPVARAFGRRDESSIRNSCERAEADPFIGELVEQLLDAIEAP